MLEIMLLLRHTLDVLLQLVHMSADKGSFCDPCGLITVICHLDKCNSKLPFLMCFIVLCVPVGVAELFPILVL